MAIKYKLPKGWHEVTVPQLMQLEEIQADKSINNEISPALVRTYLILSLFTGFPYEHFEEMKIIEAKKLAEKISFLSVYPSENAVQYFWCAGYRWKVNFNIDNLTGGNVIDHYELSKDPERVLQNCNKLIALYCTPYKFMFFKKKMDEKKKAELLIKAPVQVVYPLTVFFCKLYPLLLDSIKDYLRKQEKEMREMVEEAKA